MANINIAIAFAAVAVAQLPEGVQFSHVLVQGADAAGTPFSKSIDGVTATSADFDVVEGPLSGSVVSIDTAGNAIDGTTLTFSYTVTGPVVPPDETFPVATGVTITQS